MGKYRIIESEHGAFFPQHKRGWLSRWTYLTRDADTSSWMLAIALETRDPAHAAAFATEEGARQFIERLQQRVKMYWEKEQAQYERELQGVRVKRRIKV